MQHTQRTTRIRFAAACGLAVLILASVFLHVPWWQALAAIAVAGVAAVWLWRRRPSYRRNWMEYFDHIISGGIRYQLVSFITIIVVVVGLCILLAIWSDCSILTHEDGWGKARGVIYHFLDPGYLNDDETPAVQGFMLLISLTGMVLLGGLLITTLSNIVERRVSGVERGLVTYPGIRDHYVVIGYGEIAVCLLQNIFRHESERLPKTGKRPAERLPKIILLTNQDIPCVRARIQSQLPPELERKVILYAGNIESREHLAKLNIDTAREVYILGECEEYGRDSKNLECVRAIRELRGEAKTPLKVNVQFDRPASYSIIQKLALPPEFIADGDGKNIIYFRPFNFYENWARLLWGHYKKADYADLDFKPLDRDGRHVHLFIVGFNRMGRALLLEALRLCHYPNYDERTGANRTRITVIDKAMDDLLPQFRSQYPYLDQIGDIGIEYVTGRVEDTAVREMIAGAATDGRELVTIAVCLQDPDLSLSTGLSLPEEAYYTIGRNPEGCIAGNNDNVRILIRQELQQGIGEILDADKRKFRHVKVFGMLTDGIGRHLLDDTSAMWVNAYYDLKYAPKEGSLKRPVYDAYTEYLRKQGLKEETDILDLAAMPRHRAEAEHAARQLWYLTSEDFRFSNRYQTEMYGIYQRYAGNPALQEMEHRRWCADRSIIGYRDTCAERLKDIEFFKLHWSIVPFKDLPEKEQDKDRDVIENMKKILNLGPATLD
ncbi:MAG: hypothetical protein LUF83_05235 [Alistipes sp.]|nr:hypothetical protein [Alistipes sp.]